MKAQCDCGRPAVMSVTVVKANGELIDRVEMCGKCGFHPKTLRALQSIGIPIDKSKLEE